MGQISAPPAEQVREIVEAVFDMQQSDPQAVANSHEAAALRDEIMRVGRKLWDRQYVDGNGGNISVRIGSKYVLCTPTLVSKADLLAADISLTDLDGNTLVGTRPRTSELLLHLEIYKANPKARAVVHCHPPYATAFAVAGVAPPNGFIPEYEVFVGPAAVAPYETPGTMAFAQTVLPYVENHNTILLRNHGIVCWSDTVTHAEWLAEIIDTYCKTYMIARQIGEPLVPIAEDKIDDILRLKQKLELPDARMGRLGLPATKAADGGDELERMIEEVTARLSK